MMSVSNEGRIKSLDGLRGFAVLMVIAFHYINNQLQTDAPFLTSFGWPVALLRKSTYFGWSGVDLFFILSGFLIGNILLRNSNSRSLFKTFYIRRFFRIIPIYYLLVIIFFLLTMSPVYDARASIFSDPIPIGAFLLLIQNFYMAHYNHFGPQALTATWSLCVEEQFYLIIPFLIFIINRKYTWLLAIAGIILAVISRSLATNFYEGYTLLPSRIDSPMIGLLIAYFHQKQSFRDLVQKNINLVWGVLILVIAMAGLVYLKTDPGIFGHTILGVLFGLIVVAALYSKNNFFTRVLSNKILLQMGKLSYFLYLFHQIVNGTLHLVVLKQLTAVIDSYQAIFLTLASFLITYTLALLSFKFIETPLISYSHRFKY